MIIYLLFCLGLVCIFDIKRQQIPAPLTIGVALTCIHYGFHWAWVMPLAAFLICAVIASALNLSMPFGMGDAKLLSALGLSFGAEGLWVTFSVASLAAGLYALILVIMKKANKKDRIAFGPFIVLGFIVYFLTAYSASTFAM